MRAEDLTDEDIGHVFLVPHTLGTGRRRVLFEGFTNPPEHPAFFVSGESSRGERSSPRWLIWRCPPSTEGALRFREVGGGEFTGILVSSMTLVTLVPIEYAVRADGAIVEVTC